VLVLAASSAAGPPAGASVEIDQHATFIDSSMIVVSVVVQCPAGVSTVLQVFVSQQQPSGPNTTGSAGEFLTCDGTKQTRNEVIFGGPFTPDQAFASAYVTDELQTFDQDSRVITIS
jgi:hypothetical protein